MHPYHTTNGIKLCECGCGLPAPLASQTDAKRGYAKGQPSRFIVGHWSKMGSRRPREDRFWQKIDKRSPDECWEWQAGKNRGGYGLFDHCLAHRISYELHYGPIPEGLDCLHKCDNPPCVNPAHLFLGTQLDNSEDKLAKQREARGEGNGKSILREDDIRKIRQLHSAGIPQAEISERFGTDQSNVSCIVRYKTWRHVP